MTEFGSPAGLYALDWGMTAVSYYRELFPLFVAELFISGRYKARHLSLEDTSYTRCIYTRSILQGGVSRYTHSSL